MIDRIANKKIRTLIQVVLYASALVLVLASKGLAFYVFLAAFIITSIAGCIIYLRNKKQGTKLSLELKKSRESLALSFFCTLTLDIILRYEGIAFYILLGLFVLALLSHFVIFLRDNNKVKLTAE